MKKTQQVEETTQDQQETRIDAQVYKKLHMEHLKVKQR